MKIAEFELYADYNIITVVCRAIVGDDFHDSDFTDTDCAQGFSWHDGHVTLFAIERTTVAMEILLVDTVEICDRTVRAFQIPFRVEGNLGVDISGCMDDPISIDIPDGNYALIFENGYQGNAQTEEERYEADLWARIWFKPEENTEAKILVQDSGLNPPTTLYLKTEEDENTVGLSKGDYVERIRSTDSHAIDYYPSTEFIDKYDYCCCTDTQTIVLRYQSGRANPIFCLACSNEVEPEQLRPVLNRGLIFDLTLWRDMYSAFFALIRAFDFNKSINNQLAQYKAWGYQELESIHSAVNQKGLEIRRQLEENGRPCYYWLFEDCQKSMGYQRLKQCPKCQQALQPYEENEYPQLICKTCKIITLPTII